MYNAQSHLDSLFNQAVAYPREFNVQKGRDFCSNDYLSLKSHPHVRTRLLQFFGDEKPWCSTGSRLVSGNSVAIEHLESTFAQLVGRPRALFYANGYQANLSVITSIMAGCAVFSDELNHASLIDGIKLGQCEKTIYRHNDLDHLEAVLKRPSRQPKVIITESVFSTNGAMCDVVELDRLAKKYDAFLLIDESHATGVFGKNGEGFLSTLAHCSDNIISTHSCGKALASFGAFVACSEKIATIIKSQSRQFICTTAPPPYLAAHVHAILDVIVKDPSPKQQLWANIAHTEGVLRTSGPIIAVHIGDDDRALSIKNRLGQKDLDVAVFRYPSVKKHHAQLRITLHSGNTFNDIDRLRTELERCL